MCSQHGRIWTFTKYLCAPSGCSHTVSQHPKTLRFVFIGLRCWWCPQRENAVISTFSLLGIYNDFIMAQALFLPPHSWDEAHINYLSDEWYQPEVFLISVFDHWRAKAPEISFLVGAEFGWQCGIQQTLEIHLALSGFEWVQTYFSIIYRNTLSPWSSSLPKDLMVQNNSQDENIPLLTEVWLCSMSRELSVRPYFGIYLQTSTQSLFWLMYFFPFGKSSEKKTEIITMFQLFLLFMSCVHMFPCVLCKPHEARSDIFHSLLEQPQIAHISQLMITHSSRSSLSVASYWSRCEDSLDVHTLWKILGAEIYNSSKNIWPYKYTVYLWEW